MTDEEKRLTLAIFEYMKSLESVEIGTCYRYEATFILKQDGIGVECQYVFELDQHKKKEVERIFVNFPKKITHN